MPIGRSSAKVLGPARRTIRRRSCRCWFTTNNASPRLPDGLTEPRVRLLHSNICITINTNNTTITNNNVLTKSGPTNSLPKSIIIRSISIANIASDCRRHRVQLELLDLDVECGRRALDLLHTLGNELRLHLQVAGSPNGLLGVLLQYLNLALDVLDRRVQLIHVHGQEFSVWSYPRRRGQLHGLEAAHLLLQFVMACLELLCHR